MGRVHPGCPAVQHIWPIGQVSKARGLRAARTDRPKTPVVFVVVRLGKVSSGAPTTEPTSDAGLGPSWRDSHMVGVEGWG